MKPAPERLVLDNYPSRVDVPARFSDVDMFRHLNNVAIGQFYEEVRFALTAQLLEQIPKDRERRVIVASVATAFLREGTYPGMITVGSAIVQKGRSSCTIGQALFQDGKCISAADTVLVHLFKGAGAPFPEELDPFFAGLALKAPT